MSSRKPANCESAVYDFKVPRGSFRISIGPILPNKSNGYTLGRWILIDSRMSWFDCKLSPFVNEPRTLISEDHFQTKFWN